MIKKNTVLTDPRYDNVIIHDHGGSIFVPKTALTNHGRNKN